MDDTVGRVPCMIAVPLSDDIPSWVVPLRAAGARPPLFCVCGGGGSPLGFRDFALALPQDQPVYSFEIPPLGIARTVPTVAQLAIAYVDAVRRLQPHGPYYLCGHSFGGLVAYEMAALLAGVGEPVGVVALLDTLHPRHKRRMSRRDRFIFEARYLGDRVLKYAHNLGRGRPERVLRDGALFIVGRAKSLYWRATRVACRRLGQPPPILISSEALMVAEAWHAYEATDHDVPLVLFNAAERPAEFRRDLTLGWRACVSRPFEVHLVPGDHCSLLHPPHVQTLAHRVAPYLGVHAGADQTMDTVRT